jgi:hypothetical protein
MAKQQFDLGDAFAVPLNDGGYAVGVVARMSRSSILFGYFFGPKVPERPDSAVLTDLTPERAILVGRFGYLGIKGGAWRAIGRLPAWDEQVWTFPPLVRPEQIRGGSLLVTYDNDDPSLTVHERYFPAGVVPGGPKDGLMGAGFVETRLTRLLSDSEQ